jgi:uncharacterized protein HemX
MAVPVVEAPPVAEESVGEWANLLTATPLVAIIIGLVIALVYVYKSRERLQEQIVENEKQHTTDLVAATGAMQELTAEYLEQSFARAQDTAMVLKGVEDQQKAVVSQIGSCVSKLEALDRAGKERVDVAVDRAVTEIKLELANRQKGLS